MGSSDWWDIYWATRLRAPADPRLNKRFMDACMELEANEAFPYRPYHVGDASLPIVGPCCSAARAALSGVLRCAGGGTRTHTRLPSPDFLSPIGIVGWCAMLR